MADRQREPRVSARPRRYDHEWSARTATLDDVSVRLLAARAAWNVRNWQHKGSRTLDEVLDAIGVLYRAYQRQLQRESYLQRTYQKRLRRERNLRRMYQGQLRTERSMRRAYQLRLQRERIHYEQQMGAIAEAHGSALYGAKVARLVNLAVCAESDGEATAALAKARALHRLAA